MATSESLYRLKRARKHLENAQYNMARLRKYSPALTKIKDDLDSANWEVVEALRQVLKEKGEKLGEAWRPSWDIKNFPGRPVPRRPRGSFPRKSERIRKARGKVNEDTGETRDSSPDRSSTEEGEISDAEFEIPPRSSSAPPSPGPLSPESY